MTDNDDRTGTDEAKRDYVEEMKQIKKDRQEHHKLRESSRRSFQEDIRGIFQVYKVPLDKFGHFYMRGGNLVEDLVNPDFRELDCILAHTLQARAEILKLREEISTLKGMITKLSNKR